VLVHRNAQHALRVLGGPMTSTRHSRGRVYGGSQGFLLRGIGSPCRGEPGGEVTRQGVDGGELSLLGCTGWSWRWLGGRGVFASSHCEVGLALGLRQGGDHSLGVEGGGWFSSEREREV
jgi:hypothetical protein